MNKCLICGKELKNEDHFLCCEHYKKLVVNENYNQEYEEDLKIFLNQFNDFINKYKYLKNSTKKNLNKKFFFEYYYKYTEPEKAIANVLKKHNVNFLFDIGIKGAKEYDKQNKNHRRTDFYLIDYDIYIEYFGMENKPEYNKSTKAKKTIYKKLKMDLIDIYPKQIKIKTGYQTYKYDEAKIEMLIESKLIKILYKRIKQLKKNRKKLKEVNVN